MSNIESETLEDYLNFPDPYLYMVGFISGTNNHNRINSVSNSL